MRFLPSGHKAWLTRCWPIWLYLLGWLALAGGLAPRPVQAAGPINWSPPAQIPYIDPNVDTPFLLADGAGMIHAFSAQKVPGAFSQVIMYNRWARTMGWSQPVDILLSPLYDEAHAPVAYLDHQGLIHLVFFGGHDVSANIYYTSAPALRAADASAWSPPVAIATGARPPIALWLAGDVDEHLHMLYGGNLDGVGVYALQSNDSGQSWSLPTLVFATYNDTQWPYGLQMHDGASGRLYAAWNVVDKRGWGGAAYFTTFDFTNQRWQEPQRLAEGVAGGLLGVQNLALTEYKGELFVMYDSGLPGEGVVHLLQRTIDGGRSWSEPVRPFPEYVGGNGPGAFIIDSGGQLHVFFGQRTREGAEQRHGLWYSAWHQQVRSWGGVHDIVSGPLVQDLEGDNGFDPSMAAAIVSQGNLVLVTWRTDPGNGANGIWYSYAELDTPALMLMPLPTLTATPAPAKESNVVVIDASLTGTPLPLTPVPYTHTMTFKRLPNPAAPLLAGVLPVGIFLALLIYRRHRHQRRQRPWQRH